MTLALGLRLAVAGSRESLLRLAFMASGIGLGLTLLLLALTAPSALQGRADRVAWQDAAYALDFPGVDRPMDSAGSALFLAVSDFHDHNGMTRVYVAALGADPPVPPGLDRLPGPGEVAVSPAMRRALESTPDDQLDDRIPGRITMTIGPAGLAHDNELVAVIGRTPEQLQGGQSVQEIRGYPTRPLIGMYGYLPFLQAGLGLGAMTLILPVVVLVVMVTRVAAAQREQRLAAIRLVGATQAQIAGVAAAEAAVAAVAGALAAWAGFHVGRRILAATVTFQGGHFNVEDLTLPWWLMPSVLGGAPLLVLLMTIASLRQVRLRPLGISRPRWGRPTAWAVLPLVVGIGGLFGVAQLEQASHDVTVGGLAPLFVILQIVGYVLIGPWLCLLAGRGLARLSRRAPGLIAARRIAADPHTTFWAASGVVLAAWILTHVGSTVGSLTAFDEREAPLRPGVVRVITGGVPREQVAPVLTGQSVLVGNTGSGPVVSCAELSRVQEISCPFPQEWGWIEPEPGTQPGTVDEFFVPTDGTPGSQDRLRTRAANLVPNAKISARGDPVDYGFFFPGLGSLASVACLFVLLVGAVSLAAGMIGGLLDRRVPFALLRACGMRLGELRQVVFLQSGVTMLLTSVVGMGLGLVTAYAEATQSTVDWRWPPPSVFALIGVGVLAALLFSTFALPMVGAMTRRGAVRYE